MPHVIVKFWKIRTRAKRDGHCSLRKKISFRQDGRAEIPGLG